MNRLEIKIIVNPFEVIVNQNNRQIIKIESSNQSNHLSNFDQNVTSSNHF